MTDLVNQQTAAGTIGGTMLTIFVNIHSADLVKTGILAAVGAVVSFSVTVLIKWLLKRIKKSCFACGDRSKK